MVIAGNMTRINPSESEINSLTADGGFAHICDVLRSGGIAAIPTETVYGLAADSANSDAVAQIYTAKGRPSFNPLIVHIASISHAQKLVQWNDMAQKLADQFWPGALTMVLPSLPNNDIAPNVSAGLPTLAVRCPAHPIMQALLQETGLNLAAPSANRSGQLSATSADHVRSSFGDNAPPILDGGICHQGLESTIVAIRGNDMQSHGWEILRPGPITHDMIENILGVAACDNKQVSDDDRQTVKIEAPGQMSSHYAPKKPLRLNVAAPKMDEYFIGFGDIDCDYNLSIDGDLGKAAAKLFAALHIADNSNAAAIAVVPIPCAGVGAAINDRLNRAAVKP